MKIAVVLRRFNRVGGIERYVSEVTERFVRKHEVHLITTWYDYKIDGVNVHKFPLPRWPFFVQIFLNAIKNTLAVKWLKGKYKFDVTYSQGSESFTADVVVMHSCHKAVVKQFKRERGWGYRLLKTFEPTSNIVFLIERYVLERGSRRIIAISEVVKKEILGCYNVPEDRIAVVYNGVNLDEFNPSNKIKFRKKIRQYYGLNEDDTVLLFVANEFRRKGLEYVIRATRDLPKNVNVLVVGNDNPEPYKKIANELGVGNRVIFSGHSRSVREFYAASDIFVFPTVYEPFGLVILEAMATGMPVITSRIAGAAEIMQGREDCLLLKNPDDIEELREKIETLLSDKELMRAMGKNARKTAENHSWDRVVSDTLRVFDSIRL